MLLRQIQYFQAVVRYNSFTEAAEQYHVSQSAVSQQIQVLEKELGVKLLERKNRKFALSSAGDYFYKHSLVLMADLERVVCHTVRMGRVHESQLSIGNLICYGGKEFHTAVAEFSRQYPSIQLNILSGNHEDLYNALRLGKVDVVLNDLRRAFSDEYADIPLVQSRCFIELSTRNAISELDGVEIADLKNMPCILVASKGQRKNERSYYRDVVGFRGEFLFADSIQDARMLVVSNQGFMPIEGVRGSDFYGSTLKRIPLLREGNQVRRTYYAFWKKDNPGCYMELFAEILKAQFADADASY